MLLPIILSLLQASTPVLDGTISPGEYDHATRVTGSNGLEVFLLRTDSALFIAVRGPGDGFPHVALTHGDTVLLLHASAALGTARFAGPGEEKRRIAEFAFGVRDPGMSEAARTARARFYASEGWVGSTIRMGTRGETELVIARRLVAPSAGVAVAYWSEESSIAQWPEALADGAVAERMVQGFLPEQARFRPSEWGRLPE